MNHFWDEGEMCCNSRLEGRCVWERIGKASLGTMGKSKQCKEEGCFVCGNVFSWFLHGGFISAFDFRPRLDFKQTNCSWNKHKYGSQQPKETIHSNSIPTHCNTAFMHTKSPAVVTQTNNEAYSSNKLLVYECYSILWVYQESELFLLCPSANCGCFCRQFCLIHFS